MININCGVEALNRFDIINVVGKEFLTSNIENGEFSYPKAFKDKGLNFIGLNNSGT